MKTEHQDRAVSRWLDGELPAARAAKAETDWEASESVARTKAEFAAIGDRLRELSAPSGPAPEAAWADVRRALRTEEDGVSAAARWPGILVSRPAWAGGMLTILVLVVGIGVWFWGGGGTPALAAIPAEVESVETELPGAMTMVYQDEDTGLTIIWVQEADKQEPVDADL